MDSDEDLKADDDDDYDGDNDDCVDLALDVTDESGPLHLDHLRYLPII